MNFSTPEIAYCLEISKKKISEEEPKFNLREAGLRVALQYVFDSMIPHESGFMLFARKKTIEDKVNEILRIPNIIIWEEERDRYKKKKEILCSIEKIKIFKNRIINNADLHFFQIDMQRICSYLVESFIITNTLKTFKVKSINFLYNKSENIKESKLIFWINDERSISFKGLIADNFYKILSKDSRHGVEAENFEFTGKSLSKDLSYRNDLLSKDFKRVNTKIAKRYHEYDFVAGSADLILKDGYDYKRNPDFFYINHLT